MSLHIEVAAVKDVVLSAALAGVTIGEDSFDQPTITFNYDEAFVLVGTPDEFRSLAQRIITQADKIDEAQQRIIARAVEED